MKEISFEKVIESCERAGLSNDMSCQIINDIGVAYGAINEESQDDLFYMEKMRRIKMKS